MKKIICLLLILIASVTFADELKYNTVAIISIDALHPDAVQRQYAPNLFKLIDSGFYSPEGTSTKPPKTLIAHTAMVTGLLPEQNGKKDNNWSKSEARVSKDTMLSYAKKHGYKTALIYSKPKLGYLGSDAADNEIYSPQDAVEKATEAVDVSKPQFIFLHISGLDTEGPISGWMSPEYLDEFNFIDEQLGVLIAKIQQSPSFLIVITSDHAGHDKIHGSDHTEDYKRPLIIQSSKEIIKNVPAEALRIEGLKSYLESIL